MVKTSTKSFLKKICLAAMLCVFFLCNAEVYAQRADSVKIILRGKLPPVPSRTPQIKGSIPIYKAPTNLPIFSTTTTVKASVAKAEKNLTISKVFPNPVNDQVNIILRLEKESNLNIKILDQLSNEVMTLQNEKAQAGEQTKNFNLPKRLNTGIYYLKIVAGQESIIKKILVL